MSELVKVVAEWAALTVEVIGIGLIVILTIASLGRATMQVIKRVDNQTVFHETRQHAARGILLGLEFLIAADIIHTVAVELNFSTIGVLGVIVLIRTFLSFSLEVELSGRWPWQAHKAEDSVT